MKSEKRNSEYHIGGNKFWFLNDKLHREDGPVCVWPNGIVSYYYNGILLPKEKIDFLLDLNFPIETAIKLVYFILTKTL